MVAGRPDRHHGRVTGDRLPAALTIAGSDPSGGAGVQADLATFRAHEVWGLSAMTALTAQDGERVTEVHPVEPAVLRGQLASVAEGGALAAKTGMLATGELAAVAARWLGAAGLTAVVVDPVLWASDGTVLFDGEPGVYVDELLPLATIVTPNLAEAATLAGLPQVRDRAGMLEAAARLMTKGPRAVLVTGGHLVQGGDLMGTVSDLLVDDDGSVWLDAPRIEGPAVHGTGCVLSAAITARLARGEPLRRAVEGGRTFVAQAIARAGIDGRGAPPGTQDGPGSPRA